MMSGKFERRRPRHVTLLLNIMRILILVALVLAVVFVVKTFLPKPAPSTPSTGSTSPSTQPPETTPPATTESTLATTPPETTSPTEAYVVSTASIGAAGDVLIHTPIITAGLFDGKYNFDNIYQYVSPYFESYDYMVANLEVPLAGSKHEYQGHPTFNCPDEMADALKKAGVDMLLTANNHAYDMGHDGFLRTQSVLDEKGFDHIGTRSSNEDPVYQIKDINGIQVGMVCYTYDTSSETNGRVSLNENVLKESDRDLVNSFNYKNLDSFYTEFEGVLKDMRDDGAEIVITFVHWGYEYTLTPINHQKAMAQKLCDMGVDVIVGGHPHVLEPFETLTSENGNTTYCLYSTGNLISNQRRESLKTPPNKEYTEDGIIFGIHLQKWSDGTVEVCGLDAMPTWVARENRDGRRRYTIVPLDVTVDDWKTSFDLKDDSYLEGSYERTMSILGEGINAAREVFGQTPYLLKLD